MLILNFIINVRPAGLNVFMRKEKNLALQKHPPKNPKHNNKKHSFNRIKKQNAKIILHKNKRPMGQFAHLRNLAHIEIFFQYQICI
jgi:hypothetical protein